jgi:tetratricopeptide (TPR) repeat protein
MKIQSMVLRVVILGALLSGLIVTVNASGGGGGGAGGDDNSSASILYEKGVKADKAGDFNKALDYFKKAYDLDSTNPEILNMMAHSQRKLGMIDDALVNYKKALTIRPRFADAREYLGEAYIQAALREVDTLKSYGKEGSEQREDLVKALKDAAAGVK